MKDAVLLVAMLRDPGRTAALRPDRWTGLIAAARAERLLGSLAWRLRDIELPERVSLILSDARAEAGQARRQALWEAEMARRALAPAGVPVILLKGTAYAAAGLAASEGRSIGDLDILVPRDRLADAEAALLGAGWEWVKPDPYDDLYYRRWMHELPPLIHRERDRMIDVHHTILPLTARPKPDAAALVADSVAVSRSQNPFGLSLSKLTSFLLHRHTEEGAAFHKLRPNGVGEGGVSEGYAVRVLSPADMIVHAAAHLFADGHMDGGLRNLWDIDRLLRGFVERPDFWPELDERARRHGLAGAVRRAVRLAADLYSTPAPSHWLSGEGADTVFKARLLARDGWGRPTRPALRLGFYVRSHWLRMPPLMLARHLWTKARR